MTSRIFENCGISRTLKNSILKSCGGCALPEDLVVPELHEPGGLTCPRFYAVSWERESLDFTELARLRWIERWGLERLATHFKCSRSWIKDGLCKLRVDPDLAVIEMGPRKKRPWAIGGRSFRGV